jgi:endonuclease G
MPCAVTMACPFCTVPADRIPVVVLGRSMSPMRNVMLIAALVVVVTGCSPSTSTPPAHAPAPTTDTARQVKEQPSQPTATPPTTTRHRVDSVHVALGVPTDADPSDDIVIDETFFVLSYNADRKVPNWVSWRLTPDDIGTYERKDRFHADPLLPAGVTPVGKNDYVSTNFDRGHMCPSSHRTASEEASFATFVMTNMQPQVGTVNSGAWRVLEGYEHELVKDEGKTLYIVAGGIFDAAPKRIGPGIAVPTANYKITVVLNRPTDKVTKDTLVYAISMPNTAEVKGHKWTEYMTSVDKIEQATGYDFLPEVPDDIEGVVEARIAAAP